MKNKVNIIVEGLDRCFKTTSIQGIRNCLFSEGMNNYTIHSSQIKSKDVFNASFGHYSFMFNSLMNSQVSYVFDRAHLGEYVYGQIYRNYSDAQANSIFYHETKLKNQQNTLLILLYDSNIDRLIERDDGESFSVDKEKKQRELDLFLEAFEKSSLQKIKIDVSEYFGKSEELQKEIDCYVKRLLE